VAASVLSDALIHICAYLVVEQRPKLGDFKGVCLHRYIAARCRSVTIVASTAGSLVICGGVVGARATGFAGSAIVSCDASPTTLAIWIGH